MSEQKATYSAGQQDPRHWLVSLIRDGRAVGGPIYINAVNRLAAARLAYDELPGVRDSDTIRVWTLLEFDQKEKPGEYAAGNVRFNQPVNSNVPDGRIVETIPYSDGSIFIVVRGNQAEQAYNSVRQALINGPWVTK